MADMVERCAAPMLGEMVLSRELAHALARAARQLEAQGRDEAAMRLLDTPDRLQRSARTLLGQPMD